MLVIVYYHLVNTFRRPGPHYVTESLSHPDDPVEGHHGPGHPAEPDQE